MSRFALIPLLLALMSAAAGSRAPAPPAGNAIERGKHLVALGGCAACHSPRDEKTNLVIPGNFSGGNLGRLEKNVGVFWAPNLTSDARTGLGQWTDEQIITVLRTGVRPDGRVLSKIMPYGRLTTLTDDEARSIIAYLRSLRPVSHKVPDPVRIGQRSPTGYFTVVPAGVVK